MTSLNDRDRAFLLTLVLSASAGAIAAAAIQGALAVLRLAGQVPYPNLANHPWLVRGVLLLCGVLIGVRIGSSHWLDRQAGSAAAASVVAAFAGIAVAVVIWAIVEGGLNARETGMEVLNIPFLWIHGLIPILVGMGLGAVVQRLVRRSAGTLHCD